jgi:hypothetical protein
MSLNQTARSRREADQWKADDRRAERARAATIRQWRRRLYGRVPDLTAGKFITPALEALRRENEAKYHPRHGYSDLEIYGASYDLSEAGMMP